MFCLYYIYDLWSIRTRRSPLRQIPRYLCIKHRSSLVLIHVLCGLPVPPMATVHKWRRILLHGCNKYEVPTGPKVNLREVIINQLLYKLELHAVLRFISAFATARH